MQTTPYILMVRPAHFGYNEETAQNNAFQEIDADHTKEEIVQKAILEFDGMVAKLRDAGVEVIVFEDTDDPKTPDAVFPNNWITFHEDGTVVTYPMFAKLRRLERRADIINALGERFQIKNQIHLEEHEKQGTFLEGTGSIILDRVNKLAYACLSPRTDAELFQDFCTKLEYQPVVFNASDDEDLAIYHTNVMMAMGETFCVICLDTIKDIDERMAVIETLEETEKEVVEISMDQMMSFAGNMLQVRNTAGETILVMSQQAFDSLEEDQINQLQSHTKLLACPIDTIETSGGGSARCMMAEVFLKKR